ncbi:hypothetical protein [Streptococcus suis]|uniref:hypothetical protein n=1 Tax=Streptococcus suis TaxID=1307 RepID=UPI00211D86AD|nr:hypothetical protein [Streptococcus suis]UUM58071.1 hypothetical protein NQZ91_01470 [Streptococcus suis]
MADIWLDVKDTAGIQAIVRDCAKANQELLPCKMTGKAGLGSLTVLTLAVYKKRFALAKNDYIILMLFGFSFDRNAV